MRIGTTAMATHTFRPESAPCHHEMPAKAPIAYKLPIPRDTAVRKTQQAIPGHWPRRLVFLRLLGALWLAAALCPPASADETLGKLFFTPERRQALDRQRELNIQETQVIPEEPTLTINGVVTRSSGKQTTWINGVTQNENEKPTGISVSTSHKNPGKVLIQPADSPAAKASVGDTVNRNTGETTDLLGGGQINVRRSSPANAKTN